MRSLIQTHLVTLFSALMLPALAQAQMHVGTLAEGDQTLRNGEFVDRYTFNVTAGQQVTVDLNSTDFDTYLIVVPPSADQIDNDDYEGSTSRSLVTFTAAATGEMRVSVTSYAQGETGDYALTVEGAQPQAGQAGPDAPAGPAAMGPEAGLLHSFEIEGQLNKQDTQLTGGEFYDNYTGPNGFELELQPGQRLIFDVNSANFDTYAMVVSPSGEQQENDDFEGSTQHSRVDMVVEEAGVHRFIVTSYAANETGAYSASVRVYAPAGQNEPGFLAGDQRTFTGRLEPGDPQLSNNDEYYDTHTFVAQAGELVTIDMTSEAFDTYLILASPGQEFTQNDDGEGLGTNSHIQMQITETGTWTIYASSYGREETGAYEIRVTGLGGAAQAGGGASDTVRGDLAMSDEILTDNRRFDLYSFSGQAGQTVTLDVRSDDFDTYLLLLHNEGEDAWQNDDHEGSRSHSHLDLVLPETGTYSIFVTSYRGDETGNYELALGNITLGIDDAGPGSQATRETYAGRLEDSDPTLDDGEYYDTYPLTLTQGQTFSADLTSSDFDTWVAVISPSGGAENNDDYEGSTRRSRLDLTAEESGEYLVVVTSYAAASTGDYELEITTTGGASSNAAARADTDNNETLNGELADGDTTLRGGEYYDIFEFDAEPGEHLTLTLTSSEFDTYLVLVDPNDEQTENDDHNGQTTISQIEYDVTLPGTYEIWVTSYKEGETGSYTVSLNRGQSVAPAQVEEVGETLAGTLAEGDETLENGEYVDTFTFDATAGDTIAVDLTADDFDTYLIVLAPSGAVTQNDDWEGNIRRSRVEMELTETGTYTIAATSYAAHETGAYRIALERDAVLGNGNQPPANNDRPRGTVRGVFVGITDYSEIGASDLPLCADDARKAYDSCLNGAGMPAQFGELLMDRDATLANVRAAIERQAAQMGPDDLFVFFFSGHGTRVPLREANAFEPDRHDEAIVMSDRILLDDDLASMLNSINQGNVLVILDSCYSGGFGKDLAGPGRLALFSSPHNVESVTAPKFRAGGYLAHFMAEAMLERRNEADTNNDGGMSVLEFTSYIHERYRQELVSPAGTAEDGRETVSAGDNLGYQRLVVESEGVLPHARLFSW